MLKERVEKHTSKKFLDVLVYSLFGCHFFSATQSIGKFKIILLMALKYNLK
jgi:hypothetical protein